MEPTARKTPRVSLVLGSVWAASMPTSGEMEIASPVSKTQALLANLMFAAMLARLMNSFISLSSGKGSFGRGRDGQLRPL
jgi:hypothetical protein